MKFKDYKCSSCGHVFEEHVPDGEEFLETLSCPECKKTTAKRQLFGANIIYPSKHEAVKRRKG